MHGRRTRRRTAYAALAFALAVAAGPWPSGFGAETRADRVPPTAALDAPVRRPITPRDGSPSARRDARPPEGSGGWWLGTAGVALALALCGWASVAARRYLPKTSGGGTPGLRVVGRTSLSPKHTVYLLQVGERLLIVGAGPQGAPSLLGEVNDPEELARVAPRTVPTPTPHPTRFDHRLGDDA
jgi:hypothetical protein